MLTAPGDPAEKVAQDVTVVQINLSLNQLARPAIESAPELRQKLVEYADRQAHAYRTWQCAQWTVLGAGVPGDNASAAVNSLAGWQSGFTTDHPGVYIGVHAFGYDIHGLELVPVIDASAYGFNTAAPQLLSDLPEGLFPSHADQLHADHLKALTAGSGQRR